MPDANAWLHQTAYDVRLEWGPRGAYEAARRGDVVVLVDVLSFSTTVTAALERGASIVPFTHGDMEAAQAEALRLGVELAVDDHSGKRKKRALSPLGFKKRSKGHTYLLCSPNGATCSRIAQGGAAVLLGTIRNATAAAAKAQELAATHGASITVVPCGERWLGDPEAPEQGIRPCVEDNLGAGAVVSALEGRRSPEAALAADAFGASLRDLTGTLLACASGRELATTGFRKDVLFTAEWDASEIVPQLEGDRFPAPEAGFTIPSAARL